MHRRTALRENDWGKDAEPGVKGVTASANAPGLAEPDDDLDGDDF